jgi:predicted nucleic acid-binding protein
VDAFDADVLIYAVTAGHDLGRRVRVLLDRADAETSAGVGSVLLLPELLTKPMRLGDDEEVRQLAAVLSRLDLRPADHGVARLATALGARHGLRAADAVHLATAVAAGARRFVTNNRKDFRATIDEIEITYPADLPAPRRRRP